MKKSMSNVVAGGLIAGATVMGVDAIHNPASAAIMESTQMQDFSFDFSANTATGNQDFDFGFFGFDNNLGVLGTVTLNISFQGLTNDPFSATCCYDFLTDVNSYGGHIAGVNLTREIVIDLGAAAGATVTLEAADFAKDSNTAGLDFNTAGLDFQILFNNNAVSATGNTGGIMTLSYIYDDLTTVPIPGSAVLLAPALAALLASRAYSRRRREEDE
jgi:hypothetical protein